MEKLTETFVELKRSHPTNRVVCLTAGITRPSQLIASCRLILTQRESRPAELPEAPGVKRSPKVAAPWRLRGHHPSPRVAQPHRTMADAAAAEAR